MIEGLVVVGLAGLALVAGLGLGMILASRLDRLATRLDEADAADGADPDAGPSAGRDDEGKAG